jgi:hypothetical protein
LKQKNVVVDLLLPGDAKGSEDASHSDGSSALDIVVERAVPVAVLLEQPEGVQVSEILELRKRNAKTNKNQVSFSSYFISFFLFFKFCPTN